jgi:hypothetical protein
LERVTVADIANSELPSSVTDLTEDEGAWITR